VLPGGDRWCPQFSDRSGMHVARVDYQLGKLVVATGGRTRLRSYDSRNLLLVSGY